MVFALPHEHGAPGTVPARFQVLNPTCRDGARRSDLRFMERAKPVLFYINGHTVG